MYTKRVIQFILILFLVIFINGEVCYAKASKAPNTTSYARFYDLFTRLWKVDPAPFSQSRIDQNGGRIRYCSNLRIASENDTGVKLNDSDRIDFVAACSDFLRSKGRR